MHYKKYFREKVKFTIPNGRMTLDSVVKCKFYKPSTVKNIKAKIKNFPIPE